MAFPQSILGWRLRHHLKRPLRNRISPLLSLWELQLTSSGNVCSTSTRCSLSLAEICEQLVSCSRLNSAHRTIHNHTPNAEALQERAHTTTDPEGYEELQQALWPELRQLIAEAGETRIQTAMHYSAERSAEQCSYPMR